MPEILLSTLNARYVHAAFGLRYLLANLGELRSRAAIREFDINQRPVDVAEAILAENPSILGLGIYLWNVAPATELVAILRRLRPGLVIVLGGPEVSHEWEGQEIVRLADHVVTGEADLAFGDLCRGLLSGNPPAAKIIHAPLPDPAKVALPYDLYDERDCAHRVVYVEASRGCPFTCEFCLSSLEVPVRQFPLDAFLSSMQSLLDRGVRQFKFVDRTFNLNLMVARRILGFFLERWTPGLFVHFEMVPDRLPAELRELIARFPPGALQFEVGIQTFDLAVERLVSRRQDHGRLEDNLRWLRASTGVHVHADLIAGLPGETLGTFAAGFDRLLGLGPQEIQVGILKRLRGTPIIRHDAEFAMVYNPAPPYEVLSTRDLDFATLARLRRFAGFWGLFGNSGHFAAALPLLWEDGASPFARFMAFSDWLHQQGGKPSGIARQRQHAFLGEYLLSVPGLPEALVRERMLRDQTPRRRPAPDAGGHPNLPERQARHLEAAGS
ncbi:MAG: DUF4080 domain-containing protein [Verrucomicrobia bacterium]|nr:MAG: DUF4080 domain-containing protein [Verrucomicrobiota bacterium]